MIPRGVIGVVHVPGLPGDPRPAPGGFDGARRRSLDDAAALARGGVAAIIVENFGSAPFTKGDASARLPPHQTAFLARLVAELTGLGIPIGVNCLRNDAVTALGIAAATGAAFIRVNVHTGAYVTDQGLIEGEAATTLRYREQLGATGVAIVADVLVKHAAPLAPLSVRDAVEDTLHRGLADAIVVSGRATGARVDVARLIDAREAAGDAPVLIGSGLTPDDAEALCPLIDGAFVGTWLKRDGALSNPVDEGRVRALVEATRGRFRG
ncbi:MAG: BtpA/SgcQ family protein [Polyangiaceae bacterium]|nr:BtpA/SgcQ family protein [Polyangiaceae bacterium]